jgi:hypothetical protein
MFSKGLTPASSKENGEGLVLFLFSVLFVDSLMKIGLRTATPDAG